MPTVNIIGSGFSGLSAAAYLSARGYAVHVFEKNSTPGGRARVLHTQEGYTFDMGPSWYWMPDVFDNFFADFGYRTSDLYKLQLLNPSFRMVYNHDYLDVPADYTALKHVFEEIEKGSAARLDQFIKEAAIKYRIAMKKIVHKPGISLFEFADTNMLQHLPQLQIFRSFSKHVNSFFESEKLRALMEFPVLFLGATPQNTPALYSLMNYAALKLGTWYPVGGFGEIVSAMVKVALGQGVKFHFNAPVEKIVVQNRKAKGLRVNGATYYCDAVVASADYHHVENDLLEPGHRNYTQEYWEQKTFAPSSLIFYVGLKKKLDKLQHHTLFFEESLQQHASEIYDHPAWPTKPLFYLCSPSRTDNTVAPDGHENLFFLMPIAPGLHDREELREKYFRIMLSRLEKHLGTSQLQDHIDYKRSYCVKDFISDYNSYKGNAYGLANTLRQTAFLKPKIINKKIQNLFYAGQLTVPGPGVPPSLISGKIAANLLHKYLNKRKHEVNI